MNRGSRRDIRAELWLLMGAVFWAANYPVVKYGISGIEKFAFNGLRYFISAGVLLLLYRALRLPWTRVEPADWMRLIWAGVVAHVMYQMAFITGLNLTTAGNAAVLLATAPLWTLVINARMHREKITGRMWAGILMSLAGVVMITIGSGNDITLGSDELLGDLVCLAAAVFWALNTNMQKPLLGRYSPTQLTLVMVCVGALGLVLVGLPWVGTVDWGDVHWTFYTAALWSAIFSLALGSLIWSVGIKRIGPGLTGAFGNLIPVIAIVISYFMLGEKLHPVQFAGAGVVIFGVWSARH
jgi:drug/metabolite transporter (DMT)-like permease